MPFEIVNEIHCKLVRAVAAICPVVEGRTGLRIKKNGLVQRVARHDKIINASKNILAVGLNRLAEEIPHFWEEVNQNSVAILAQPHQRYRLLSDFGSHSHSSTRNRIGLIDIILTTNTEFGLPMAFIITVATYPKQQC